MENFLDWFNTKLSVERYPLPTQLMENKNDIDYVINVSDEYIEQCLLSCELARVRYFWFPLTEVTPMGLNCIYGALQILWIAESQNKKVLLHCHVGSNRSVTVAECYYYLRTKTYLKRKDNPKLDKDILDMFIFDSEQEKIETEKRFKNSRVQDNIDNMVLPSKNILEKFLKECAIKFENYQIASGGNLDRIKIDSRILNY